MALPKKSLTFDREQRSWALSLLGHPVRLIAEMLASEGLGPIGPSGVQAILSRVRRRRLSAMNEDLASHALAQLDRLEHVWSEAIQSWHASKVPAPTPRSPAKVPAKGKAPASTPAAPASLVSTGGDPRYLGEARAALTDLRKLLGLNSPDQLLVGGVRDADPIRLEMRRGLKSLGVEELRDLRRIAARMAGRDGPDGPDGPPQPPAPGESP